MPQLFDDYEISTSTVPKTIIHLALTDDWELRGNGSGDIHQIQFRAMRELLRVYEAHGVRATFNAEVMQQLTFRKFQDRYPELGLLADEWDEHVRDAFSRGQDIQLHIHPQWSRVEYADGKWKLSGKWALPDYDTDEAFSMLAAGKEYLEDLLRPVDPGYRCVAFRSGSSAIAPSKFALSHLAKLGIVFDMSIVGGLQAKTKNLTIDYSQCEEERLPFYPRMEDARRVSDKAEPIVCVPIFNFTLSRRRSFKQVAAKGLQKVQQKLGRGSKGTGGGAAEGGDWLELERSSFLARGYDKAIKPCVEGKQMVADIGTLDYPALREMLAKIQRLAQSTGLAQVPVILTNHSKYVTDFRPIERFLKLAGESDNITFATLSDVAAKLIKGEFNVRIS